MPIRVGLTPEGQRLLATEPKAGVLRVYDFETREQAGEVELGGQPIGFVVNPKMNTVLVSLAQAGEVAEVDLAKLTVKRRLKTGPVPDGIALVMVAGRAEVAQAAAGADPQDPMPDGPAGRKPRLGVILEPTFDGEGVQIAQVTPATLAEQVGLQAGDVVLSIDGTPITDPQQMAKLVFDANPGQTLKFRIVRKGQELDVAVKLH